MRKFMVLASIYALISGCASGYQQFYKPYADATTLQDVEILANGAEPLVIEAPLSEFNERINAMEAKGYDPIGYSSFNGKSENYRNAIAQAKKVKATHVLVGKEYASTERNTSTLALPNTSTTYNNGTVTAGDMYGTYRESSTTYGTSYVPITTTQYRYNQSAMFFVKSTKKFRFGMIMKNIPQEKRAELGRNTGAIISVVREGTPAFYANLFKGDIIDAVDGVKVRDVGHASEILAKVPKDAASSRLSILRAGQPMDIVVELR